MLAFNPVCTRRMQFESLRLWNQSGSGIQRPFYRMHYFTALVKLVPVVMFLFPFFFLCSLVCAYPLHLFSSCLCSFWCLTSKLAFLWKASLSLSNLTHTTVATKFTRCVCSIFEFPTITLCRLTRKWLQNVIQLFALWRQNLIYPDNSVQCMKQRTVI